MWARREQYKNSSDDKTMQIMQSQGRSEVLLII